MRLTPRGTGVLLGAAASWVASLWTASLSLVYVAGALVGMVVGAGAYALLLPSRVDVTRELDHDVIETGEGTRVRLRFTTDSVLPVGSLLWRDALPAAVHGASSGVVGSVGTDAVVIAEYTVVGIRRGEHAMGPVEVSAGDPLGLVLVRRRVGTTSGLTVLPEIIDLPDLDIGTRAAGLSAWAPHQSVGTGDEDVIARPYVAGDAMRRIHWKATARHGELMTRQEEAVDDRRVAIVLDALASGHEGRVDRDERDAQPGFEWAVQAAASACASLVDQGDRVFLHLVGAPTPARDITRDAHRDSLLDGLVDLGRVEPTGADRDASLLATVAPLLDGDPALVLLVLGRVDRARAEAWSHMVGGQASAAALVSHASHPDAVAFLRDAGWRVVEYLPGDDVAAALAALHPAAEPRHAPR